MKLLLFTILAGSLCVCAYPQDGPIRLDAPQTKVEAKAGPTAGKAVSDSVYKDPNAKVEVVVPEIVDEKQAVQLDPDGASPWWMNIEDDAPLRGQKDNEDEYRAFNFALSFANRQSAEALARHSLKDVKFADLFYNVRQDYARQLIHLEGRLASLKKIRLPKDSALSQAEKISEYYEGWMFPGNELHPVCIVFTELPEGVVPGDRLSHTIKFDGYSFKLIRYESQEVKKDNTGQWRKAPLLIGKAISLSTPPPVSTGGGGVTFITIVLGAVLTIVVSAVALSLWFRAGDQKVRSRLTKLQTNPFDENPVLAPLTSPLDLDGGVDGRFGVDRPDR